MRLLSRAVSAVVCAACAAVVSVAIATPPTTAPATFQDVVYTGAIPPVWIRIHTALDGRPATSPWDEYVRQIFAHCDADGDQKLSPVEAAHAPPAERLIDFMRGTVDARNVNPDKPARRPFDKDHDGFISPDELATYYRTAPGPVQFQSVASNAASAQALDAALLKHLDANNDGRLADAELRTAHKLLTLDGDDDENISAQELISNGAPPVPMQADPEMMGMARKAAAPEKPCFVRIARRGVGLKAHAHEDSVKELMEALDVDGSAFVSRAEAALDKPSFDQIDGDADDKVTLAELVDHFDREPDLELDLNLSADPAKPSTFAVRSTRTSGAALVVRFASAGPSPSLSFTHANNTTATLMAPSVAATASADDPIRQSHLTIFRALDPSQSGVVDLKELPDAGYTAASMPLLMLADRDSNSKVTADEFAALLDLCAAAPRATLTFTAVTSAPGLFEAIDANRDNRLSARELKSAWPALQSRAGAAHQEAASLAPADLPWRFHLIATTGQSFAQAARLANPARAVSTAPQWFQKMDASGDDELTPREFLGPPDAFKSLDRNTDGVLTPDEAAAAARAR